jgi:hypothetical protein
MTLQIVITRPAGGGFHILEMGYGQGGRGETLREHDLQPEISVEMATRYLMRILETLHSRPKDAQ